MGSLRVDIQPSESPGWWAIVELAERQYGVIGRDQLLRLGLGREAIKHRVRSGSLHRVHRAVYSLAPPSLLSLHGRWVAAALACGPRAVVSHRDGAQVHGVWRTARARIDVTAPRSRHAPAGVELHRTRGLDPRDFVTKEGIPVTSLPRTLLDCAAVLEPRRVERMLEEAERIRALDLRAVTEVVERTAGHRGRARLVACIGSTLEEAQHTRLEFERLLLDVCRAAGLPLPAMNVWVEGHEVDGHWPGTTLIAEIDSWAFHRTRAAFERDRARDLKLSLAGYTVVRITWRRLTERQGELARDLRALLDSCRTPRARGRGAPARAWP